MTQDNEKQTHQPQQQTIPTPPQVQEAAGKPGGAAAAAPPKRSGSPPPPPHPAIRITLAALLVGTLVATKMLSLRDSQGPKTAAGIAASPEASQAALARYGFRLTESAKASGVDFTHEAPKLDPKLAHILPRIADMGAGVAVADFDKDGWQDFYVTNSGENSRNRLYRNLGDGKFEEVAQKLGVADVNRDGTGVSMGAVWGDYDNDGYDDLFVYK